MTVDEYLPYVRRFVETIERDFPLEDFELGDKLLLGHTARRVAQELREEREDRALLMSAKHYLLTMSEMKKEFGFRPGLKLEDFF